jgi:signal transduction histidine kinase
LQARRRVGLSLSRSERCSPDSAPGFRALLDSIPVGVVWIDWNGRAVDWNAEAESMLRSSAGPRLEETLARLHRKCAESGECVQATCEILGAERVWVSMSPDREPRGFVAVIDRRRLEKARSEAAVLREVLKALASSASRQEAIKSALSIVRGSMPLSQLAYFVLEKGGPAFTCIATSGILETGFDAPVASPAGHAALLCALKSAAPVHFPDAAEHREWLPFEPPQRCASVLLPVGRRVSSGVLYVSAPAEGLGEGALRVIQALADAIGALEDLVTMEAETARAREVASQRDRLATIGQLVAGVAHEINNPLAFLKSNLTTLHDEAEELVAANGVGEVLEIVAECLEGVSRIEIMVQALKGTARKSQEKIRFDVIRAVTEAVTIFRGAKKAECEVALEVADAPEVMGSPSAIGQVVLNLLQNSLDAMSALKREARKIEVRAQAAGDAVLVSVRDHGTGIPPDVERRMFDAFFTTKEPGKGTGLGLYICREIIDEMGGTLRFTTGAGGTTFEFDLPAAC